MLVALNSMLSVALFIFAGTMTVSGFRLAEFTNFGDALRALQIDAFPYLALVPLAVSVAISIRTRASRGMPAVRRLANYGIAAILLAAALWLGAIFGYARFVPWVFRPVFSAAGGELINQVRVADRVIASYLEPTVVAILGFLLAVKQIKSSVQAERRFAAGRLAIVGLTASVGALCVALYVWNLRLNIDRGFGSWIVEINDSASEQGGQTFASLFAPGVRCRVSDLYGWRIDPFNYKRLEDHIGIDLGVKAGTPVRAMSDGKIIFANRDGGLGNVVALQVQGAHQPTLITGHLQKFAVRPGDDVRRGDIIGFAGSTGRSTGPHVHLQACSDARTDHGRLLCTTPLNPYHVWPALSALANMSCDDGPKVF